MISSDYILIQFFWLPITQLLMERQRLFSLMIPTFRFPAPPSNAPRAHSSAEVVSLNHLGRDKRGPSPCWCF